MSYGLAFDCPSTTTSLPNALPYKVITTMMIRPLDDPTYPKIQFYLKHADIVSVISCFSYVSCNSHPSKLTFVNSLRYGRFQIEENRYSTSGFAAPFEQLKELFHNFFNENFSFSSRKRSIVSGMIASGES